jgi:thioredoxin 1
MRSGLRATYAGDWNPATAGAKGRTARTSPVISHGASTATAARTRRAIGSSAGADVSESRCLEDCREQALEGKRMSSELIKHITDESFTNDVLESDVPVLVDYWAEWCGPCKMIAPILDEMAKDYDGRLQIAKMNVDDNREVPGKFGIRGIPTLMIFKGGQKVAELTGARPKRELTAFVDGHL